MTNSRTSHVLTTLGLLFIVGGVVRVLPTAAADPDSQLETDAPTQSALETSRTQDGDISQCDQALADILAPDNAARAAAQEALRIDTLELQAREQALEAREQDLEALRKLLDAKWEQLVEEADKDVLHLAAMYSAMKPKEAAVIFDQMDPSFAAGFLREMPGETAGQILAEMNADRAYRISIEIAARGAEIRRISD